MSVAQFLQSIKRVATQSPDPPRILVGDDEESSRHVLRRILEGAGYRVVEAGTAAETRRLVYDSNSRPSLVILDVHFPDGNGYELCRAIKKDPRVGAIPVLQMSAIFTKNIDRVQGLECGADSYLVQPVDPGALVATVRALLRIGKFEAEREALLQRERQACREAELERQKLYSIIMQAPAVIGILRGPDHIFELVNPLGRTLFGEREILGMKIRDAVPEYEVRGNLEILDKAYQSGQPQTVNERPIQLKQADGRFSSRFFNFSYQPWKDIHGGVAGVIVIAIDVTEQVLARQKIEELAINLNLAIKARDSFISVASHELKTPLFSLKLRCQVAARALRRNNPLILTAEKIRNLIAWTDHEIDRLIHLVEDMLDVSWIETGRLSLNIERIDLCALVRDIVENVASEFFSTNSNVSLEAPVPVIGYWDRHRLEQTIIILLSNAFKYGAGKPVAITVEKRAGTAIIKVRDQGLGIASDKQERIFEQFERAISSENISGFGLGLFIARNIVTQHKGTIQVESKLGEGTTFVVELPLSALEMRKAS
jgi:PAS domain S-box-containing protein